MDIKELVSRIGFFRNKRNLSARELSLLIGKNEGYISRLESMEFTLTTSVLLDIVEALDISCAEFFSDEYRNYKNDNEIFELLKTIPSDSKNSLINIMKNLK